MCRYAEHATNSKYLGIWAGPGKAEGKAWIGSEGAGGEGGAGAGKGRGRRPDLMGVCQSHLHGASSMLDGGQGGRPGTPVMPTDLDDVGIGFGHAAGHRADAGLRHQLH